MCIEVIAAVLRSDELRGIIQHKRSEDQISKDLDRYFVKAILEGG